MGNTGMSGAYNAILRNLTVGIAMLRWIQNPPDLWKDVVKLHFGKNGEKILEQLQRWEGMGYRGGNYQMEQIIGTVFGQYNMNIAVLRQQLHGALHSAGFMKSKPSSNAGYGSAGYSGGSGGYGGSGYGGHGYGGHGSSR